MPEPMPTALPRAFVAGLEGAFLAHGTDPDPDSAFDDAVSTAWYEVGHAGLIPSVADCEVSDLQVLEDAPAPLGAALLAARAALECLEGPGLFALAVAPDRFYRRRRVRARFDDPALDLPGEPGVIVHPSPDLADLLNAAAAAAGTPLEEHERLEQLELAGVRRRYKAVATSHSKLPAERGYVLTHSGTILEDLHRTASEARRAGLAIAKAGPFGAEETYRIDVVGQTGREGRLPHVSIERSCVAQRGRLVATYATEKDPAKTKTAGWLFYGRSG